MICTLTQLVFRTIKNVGNWGKKNLSKLLKDIQLLESGFESRTFWLQSYIPCSIPTSSFSPSFSTAFCLGRTQPQHHTWATCGRKWQMCLLAFKVLHIWLLSFPSEFPVDFCPGIQEMLVEAIKSTPTHHPLLPPPPTHTYWALTPATLFYKERKFYNKHTLFQSSAWVLSHGSPSLTVSCCGSGSGSASPMDLSHLKAGGQGHYSKFTCSHELGTGETNPNYLLLTSLF